MGYLSCFYPFAVIKKYCPNKLVCCHFDKYRYDSWVKE